jgi:uncharacterized protein (TIGR02246 family)
MSPLDADAAQTLHDERAISKLMTSFVQCLDRRDWTGYARTFTSDGVFVILGQEHHGWDDIAAGPARDLARFHRTQHFSTNHVVTVHGDTVEAIHYLLGVHVHSSSGQRFHADIGGQYECRCERTDEGWRFRRVELEIWWSGGQAVTIEPTNAQGGAYE